MNPKTLLSLCAALLLSAAAHAQEIRDVDVTVRLQKDGTAFVTQVWDVTPASGTEWYLPIQNLGQMQVKDLKVSEGGRAFASDGYEWDVDRTREQKAFRCGIVVKGSDGVELCWGLGSLEPHVWTAEFTVTGLVQALQDYDAFNYQFVNDHLVVGPEHAKVTLINETGSAPWSEENAGIWSFGYTGTILFEDGSIVAESTEPLPREGSVIVMCRFAKGLFEPSVSRDIPFEEMKEKAFKGSQYGEKDSSFANILGWIILFGFALVLLGVPLLLLGYGIWYLWAKVTGHHYKPSVFGASKVKGWFREPPMDGDLTAAYSLLTEGNRIGKKFDSNLIGAYFLKWIQDGVLRPVPDEKHPSRVNLAFPEEDPAFDDAVQADLYLMAKEAAKQNRILEKDEFEKWAKSHYRKLLNWPGKAKSAGRSRWNAASVEDRANLLRFKNFLNDFTLVKDRGAIEVGLWKSYLLYAQLFGIADKVAGNFKNLYPEQFGQYIQSIGIRDFAGFTSILSDTSSSARSMMNYAYSRSASSGGRGGGWSSSGGGGWSSFGGGGGFSGGGSGGGTR